jgi:hypothetical protein
MRRLELPLPVALIGALMALAAIAAMAAVAPGSPLVASCAGAGPNHAALVLEHGDGSVVTRCVSFDTATVTGEALLDASGVAWSAQSFGGYGEAVCALDAEPAHYSECPGTEDYWAVFVSRDGGVWQLASVGISALTLGDGDAEGFRYVPAAGAPAPPPRAGACPVAPAPTPIRSPGSGLGSVTTAPARSQLPTASPAASGTGVATRMTPAAVSADSSRPSVAVDGTTVSTAGDSSRTRDADPKPSGGVDVGLLMAACGAGGLAGLALLRLGPGRRSGP